MGDCVSSRSPSILSLSYASSDWSYDFVIEKVPIFPDFFIEKPEIDLKKENLANEQQLVSFGEQYSAHMIHNQVPQINAITIQTPQPIFIFDYIPVHFTPNLVSIPDPLQIPPEPSNPNYSAIRKQINPLSNILLDFSIAFPYLPFLQDVVVPDFNFQEVDIDALQTKYDIQISSIPFPNIQYTNKQLKANYLKRVGYINHYVDDLYRSERTFFRNLFNFIENNLSSELNFYGLLLLLETYITQEKLNFRNHLTLKQRLILKAILNYKFYRELLQGHIKRLNTILDSFRLKIEEVIRRNQWLFEYWQTKTNLIQEYFKTNLSTIKGNTRAYEQVIQINKNLKSIYFELLDLIEIGIVATILNIERERLFLDHDIALLNFNIANEKQQLPPLKKQELQALDTLYNTRFQLLQYLLNNLALRVQVAGKRRELYNKRILYEVQEGIAQQEIGKNKLKILKRKLELELLQQKLRLYEKSIDEYISLYRMVLDGRLDNERLIQRLYSIEYETSKLKNEVEGALDYYNEMVLAWNDALNWGLASANELARANICASITESYS